MTARSRQPGTTHGPGTMYHPCCDIRHPWPIVGEGPAQPDGPQEIDAERLTRALGESALVFVVTDRLEDAAAELAAAYRAQQPEGGAGD